MSKVVSETDSRDKRSPEYRIPEIVFCSNLQPVGLEISRYMLRLLLNLSGQPFVHRKVEEHPCNHNLQLETLELIHYDGWSESLDLKQKQVWSFQQKEIFDPHDVPSGIVLFLISSHSAENL
jgi:hypothetical protein